MFEQYMFVKVCFELELVDMTKKKKLLYVGLHDYDKKNHNCRLFP